MVNHFVLYRLKFPFQVDFLILVSLKQNPPRPLASGRVDPGFKTPQSPVPGEGFTPPLPLPGGSARGVVGGLENIMALRGLQGIPQGPPRPLQGALRNYQKTSRIYSKIALWASSGTPKGLPGDPQGIPQGPPRPLQGALRK